MKILLIISLALFTFSCQSEYDRQLSHCKSLVNNVITIEKRAITGSLTSKELINEINFRAHLSGNERLFKIQIKAYTQSKIEGCHSKELLTSFQ